MAVTSISTLSPKVASKSRGLTELLSRSLDAVGVCVRPDLGPQVVEAAKESSKTGRAVRVGECANLETAGYKWATD